MDSTTPAAWTVREHGRGYPWQSRRRVGVGEHDEKVADREVGKPRRGETRKTMAQNCVLRKAGERAQHTTDHFVHVFIAVKSRVCMRM